jgi:Carbohydrate-selective porin, OprB family
MSHFSWKLLFAVPAAYVISFFAPGNAFAASNIQPEEVAITAAPSSLDEVETVANTTADLVVAKNEGAAEANALIQPADWQYTSLQDLDGKYDCNTGLTGAPISRADFATALNSCLQKAEPLLAKKAKSRRTIRKKPPTVAPASVPAPEAAPAPAPAPEAAPAVPAPVDTSAQDIEALKRLTQEFRAELSNLDVRVQKVEKTVLAQSQASQFSTTTKLKGEVAIGLNGVLSGGGTGSNPTVGSRVRLLLETSFTGKDKLFTRLATGNVAGFGNLQGANPAGTEGALTFAGNTSNAIAIDWLAYQFPIGSGSVYAAAVNGIHSDYLDTHNPYFQDFTGASGALSSFAEENPIYKIGGGTGIGVTLPLSSGTFLDSVNLSYFGGTTANSPATTSGIFGGRNSILAQVNFKPSDKFDFGIAYVRGFHNDGAIFDFGSGGAIVGSSLTAPSGGAGTGYSTSNSFGLSAAYKASDSLSLNGFVTTTSADLTAGGNNSILTYALGAAFPNVGQPGNLLGIFAGQSPSVTNAANGNSYHLEGFYKYKLNDGLSITPGLIYLTNPNQAGNGGSLLGTVRTTFTF